MTTPPDASPIASGSPVNMGLVLAILEGIFKGHHDSNLLESNAAWGNYARTMLPCTTAPSQISADACLSSVADRYSSPAPAAFVFSQDEFRSVAMKCSASTFVTGFSLGPASSASRIMPVKSRSHTFWQVDGLSNRSIETILSPTATAKPVAPSTYFNRLWYSIQGGPCTNRTCPPLPRCRSGSQGKPSDDRLRSRPGPDRIGGRDLPLRTGERFS